MEAGPPTLTRESACGPRRSAKRAAESERGWGPASIEQRHCREYFKKPAEQAGFFFVCQVRGRRRKSIVHLDEEEFETPVARKSGGRSFFGFQPPFRLVR